MKPPTGRVRGAVRHLLRRLAAASGLADALARAEALGRDSALREEAVLAKLDLLAEQQAAVLRRLGEIASDSTVADAVEQAVAGRLLALDRRSRGPPEGPKATAARIAARIERATLRSRRRRPR